MDGLRVSYCPDIKGLLEDTQTERRRGKKIVIFRLLTAFSVASLEFARKTVFFNLIFSDYNAVKEKIMPVVLRRRQQ